MKLAHLDLATSYSLLQSTIKINDLINKAKEDKLEVLAIADINIMYGAIEFYKECKKNDIKPLIGLNVQVEGFNFIAYAKNFNGYKNLISISTIINNEGDLNDINNKLEDLIIISDTLQKADYKYDDVIKGEVRYILENDYVPYEVTKAIGTAEQLVVSEIKDEKKFFSDLGSLSSVQKTNVANIIDACDLEIVLGQAILPKFPTPNEIDSDEYLKTLCYEGLKYKFGDTVLEVYVERINHELGVIKKMGFADYFLIVCDIIMNARKMGVRVGPGRGSAAGSLVAYALAITDVDPIKYGLLFERFLNEERISMPDIDIDFQDTRREEVIKYVVDKYGKDRVASIITYQTIAAKSSIRDVARVIGIDLKDADKISKLIPSIPGTTLDDAIKTSKFKTTIDSKQEYKILFKIAKSIEGIPRNYSTHAAGIVLADKKLENYVPLQSGHNDIAMAQYSMYHLEELGLLKIDLLGLRNLTTISEILSLIKHRHGKYIKLSKIPDNDKKTLDTLSNGLTTGIFQLESNGMKSVLKRLGVSSLEDIVSTSSLYRPGPQENIGSFIDRKHGREKIDFIIDDLKPIIEGTYGIIVYQEQIMNIAQKLCGWTLAKADILRRAMGKKDAKVLKGMKEEFVQDAIKNGYDEPTINKVYELIYKFADYGFNRSHAVAYSLIGYQMAYLKANYTLEFMSSLLSSVVGSADKMSAYITECNDYGIEIVAPDINLAMNYFVINGEKLIMPINALKGVGEAVFKELHRIRGDKPFKSFSDFVGRAQEGKIPSGAIEKFIKAGSFDSFGIGRQDLIKNLDDVLTWASTCSVKTKEGVKFDPTLMPELYIAESENDAKECGQYELDTLGFYLKYNPLESVKVDGALPIIELNKLDNKSTATVFGILKTFRKITTKWGQDMAFGVLEDGTAKTDVMFSPTVYAENVNILKTGAKMICQGEVQQTSKRNFKVKTIKVVE